MGTMEAVVTVNTTGRPPRVRQSAGQSHSAGQSNSAGQSHVVRCAVQKYCLNGGTCFYQKDLDLSFCRCSMKYTGKICQYENIFDLIRDMKILDEKRHDRVATIAAIVIGCLVLITMFIAAYFLARRRRKKFYQNREKRRQERENMNAGNYVPVPRGREDKVLQNKPTPGKEMGIQTDPLEMTVMLPPPSDPPAHSVALYATPVRRPTPLSVVCYGSDTEYDDMKRQRLQGISTPDYETDSPMGRMPNAEIVNAVVEPSERTKRLSIGSRSSRSSRGSRHGVPGYVPPLNSPQRLTGGSNINCLLGTSAMDVEPHSDYENNQPSDENELNAIRAQDQHAEPHKGLLPNYKAHDKGAGYDIASTSSDTSDTESSSSGPGQERELFNQLKNHRMPALQNKREHGSADRMAWDEYGNTEPRYATDQYAFNPYAIDDDIIDNCYANAALPKKHKVANKENNFHGHRHDRLLGIADDPDATPV